MNRKQIIPVLVVLLVGAGVFYWAHHSHQSESESSDETVPTVVTVQVGQLRRATLHGYVSGYGIIQPAPAAGATAAATARVAAPTAGIVKRVLVTEGSQVKSGAVLVELEDRAAEVAVKNAEVAAGRQKQLYAENNTSQKNLEEALAQLALAQAQLSLLRVTAPLDGTVVHLNVRPGEAVDLTAVVAEITDLSRLVVAVDIPSSEARRIKLGDTVEVGGAQSIMTTVNAISPEVDATTDTVTVRAPIPADRGLRSGATVHVKIMTEEHVDSLAAPAPSVVTHDDGSAVVAVVKANEATQVPVTVGLREGDLVEIAAKGLQAGDTVVTVGAYGLPEKTKVRVETPPPAAH